MPNNSTTNISGMIPYGLDRYRSFHIQTEDYLLEYFCYIELNPIRANMMEDAKK